MSDTVAVPWGRPAIFVSALLVVRESLAVTTLLSSERQQTALKSGVPGWSVSLLPSEPLTLSQEEVSKLEVVPKGLIKDQPPHRSGHT